MDKSESTNKRTDAGQSRRLSLIDVSAEDDSLLNSFAGDNMFSISEDQESRNFQLFEGMASNKLEDVPENFELTQQVTEPSESLEPEMTKQSGKYNLRKSLAWDSAFFTSAGVLDPEELSCMIEGDKTGKKMLPGIQEEVHRSTDSISTLESDTLTLESIEANLFEDVRASIQKSSKASKAVNESMKDGSGVTETNNSSSSKGVDVVSQNKVMPRLASKKPTVSVQKPGKAKKPSTCPVVSQSVSARGDGTSLLKQTRLLGKPSPSPTPLTKRASLGSNLIQMEKDNVKSTTGRGAPLPKIPETKREGASSSIDNSGSTSNNIGPFNSKRKTDSRTANPPSFGFTCKTPPRIEPGNKSQSGKSHLSTNKVPGTKLLTITSPARSWSSESSSSSSISTLNKTSYSPRVSLDTGSSKSSSVEGDVPEILDLENHAYDQSSTGDETQVTGVRRRCDVKASTENSALPPASKPSGLRLPSPKIGFFDGAKSVVSSPKGSMQPHPIIRSGLPKSGARNVSLSTGQNKGKVGKLQAVRNVSKLGNKTPDAQKTSLNTKPNSLVPLQQASSAAKKVFSPSRNSISPTVPSKGRHKSGRENHLKGEKVGTEGLGIDINERENCVVELKDSSAFSKDKVSPQSKVHSHGKAAKVTPIDGGSPTIFDTSSTFDADNITLSDKMGDATYEPSDFKQTERSHLEDQVGGLSK
ncbi:cell wall protein DAN4-like [Pyrus ussuriensis x Pyrus communis]|uniref:Cell wall protein DAN4-like n=1 Tax=Pyrus ussuriensis x Pyrus communis TaxID=2448454 RepID=A0A5N5H2Z9_9ROSA|nr:cell wall protein DAN4-like [Pyrus ussuriensis x Pyrus communis]